MGCEHCDFGIWGFEGLKDLNDMNLQIKFRDRSFLLARLAIWTVERVFEEFNLS